MTGEQNNLYDKEIWDAGYKNFKFFKAGDADPVKSFIKKYIPKSPGECFEIGCFPGRYLSILGDEGWILNGVDQTEHLNSLMAWLKSNSYKLGNIVNENFEKFCSDVQYDLVYSCGFVEHFTNWEDIIEQHLKLVKDDGFIIITTPNFRGIQGLLHRTLDEVNYYRHNPRSMDPAKWKKIVERHGFQVKKFGHFGRFDFWYGWQSRPYYKRFFLYRFMSILPFLKKVIFFDSFLLSPFCGIVAQKKII